MMKKFLIVFIIKVFLFFNLFAFPNIQKPVKWNYKINFLSSKDFELIVTGEISDEWHVYGPKIPDNMPIPISINISTTKNSKIIGKPIFISKTKTIYDSILLKKLEIFEKEIKFKQLFEIVDNNIHSPIKVFITYMACNNSMCTPPIEDSLLISIKSQQNNQQIKIDSNTINYNNLENIQITEKKEIITNENTKETQSISQQRKKTIENFLLSLLAGLGALLTPCVYPMIPLTISYFLRKNKTRKQYIFEAIIFGLSLIFIYSSLGLIVTLIRNPNAIYTLTTHWIPNLIFAFLFILFAISFLGYFEIILPSSLTDKIDKRADKGGVLGSFFMALAMALLSFSCTGPFVATLLIKASQGNLFDPLIGMFGFGLSFSIPFTLLAIFPSYINKLPKSGSWLNFIKISIAFILLLSSTYFLNKINQSYHLNIDIFINSFLVAILLFYFMYLIGKISFHYEETKENLSIIRLILAIITLTFAIYLFSKNINSVTISKIRYNEVISNTSDLCKKPSYSEFLKLPHNLSGYFDYEEAVNCAKIVNKPILVDFVGHSCSNCKKMYDKVWSDPEVQALLKNFVIAALYVDDKTLLPEDKWYTSTFDGKTKKTIGQKNADIQLRKFNTNALPSYFIIDHEENILSEGFYFSTNIKDFKNFLNNGLKKFKEKHNYANYKENK